MAREFCPTGCAGLKDNRICTARTYLSDWDRSKDRCFRLDDVVIEPYEIEIRWTRDSYRKTQVVGRNGGDLILADGGRVKASSPLIKK